MITRKFNPIYKVGKVKGHVRLRADGRFEIRCNYQKTPISGSGKTLQEAKNHFRFNLEKAMCIEEEEIDTSPKVYDFCEFAEFWFETVKKPTVKPNTYKSLLSTYNSQIKPYFANQKLPNITPLQIQPFFNKLQKENKTRTSELAKLILMQIFQAANDERLIPSNPMRSVRVLQYETQKGEALTYEEEVEFLKTIHGTPYELAFVILLYGGMRRGELASLTVKDDFLYVKNNKKKITQKDSFRKIPITPMLRPYFDNVSAEDIQKASSTYKEVLTHRFKMYCPNHHLHELRHTFITRCQECGVSREVVSVWAGHAADKTMTSTVYTHFSEEFMQEQGQKVDYYNRLKAKKPNF